MRDLEADLKLCEEMDAAFWEWSDGDTWHKATQSFKAGVAALRELQAVYAVMETGTGLFRVSERVCIHKEHYGARAWAVSVDGVFDPVPPHGKKQAKVKQHPTPRAALHRAWELAKE